MQASMSDLLRIEGLGVSFSLHGLWHEVVRGVSFRVRRGSVVALVGESGSGKSVIAHATMGLLPAAGAISRGRILFADPAPGGRITDIAAHSPYGSEMRALRGSRMSMIF